MHAPLMIVALLLMPGFCYGQIIFRSTADSVQYERLTLQIGENMRRDPKTDNEELHRLREMLVVKAIPAYKAGTYTFYKDLLRSDQRDTIRRLGLYNPGLKKLPTAVGDCPNLVELDISACGITELPAWLSNLSHLETIVVTKSNRKILRLRIPSNQSLKHLDLSYNNLRRIPRGIRACDSLQYLNLSGNRIRRIPRFLRHCATLSYVNISYNRLRSNKIRFRSNPNLRGINISHNQLTDLPFSLANFDNLQEIDLSYNRIEKIRKEIAGNSLRVLSLYNNRLRQIPERILELSGLIKLDLSFNRIDAVSPDIRNLRKLTFLALSDNQLTEVPNEIGALTRLQSLFLENNQLTSLPESMSNLQLKRLDVGFNRLQDFPFCVLNYKDLEELYINNNLIGSVPTGLLAMKQLRIFYLDGNSALHDSDSTRTIMKQLHDKGVEVKY